MGARQRADKHGSGHRRNSGDLRPEARPAPSGLRRRATRATRHRLGAAAGNQSGNHSRFT